MMFPFGKPVPGATSDTIQSRRAMTHHGPSIVVLSTRWSMLCPCTYVHGNRARVGAFPATKFHRVERAFPGRYRSKPLDCVRDCAFRRISPMRVR